MLSRLSAGLKPAADQLKALWLSIAGLSAFTTAAFTVNDTVGWAVTGAAALVLEWRVDTDA